MKRAERRSALIRKKAKANKLGLPTRLANHLASCSCFMCGNPRKHFKEKTLQEYIVIEKEKQYERD